MLEIVTYELGPVITNAYLVADPATKEAVAIDPAWDGEIIANEASRRGWHIANIWLTHAHFDHLGGATAVVKSVNPAPPIALHPDDLPLYHMQGGAPYFGMRIDPPPEPTITLRHGDHLHLGKYDFEVRHTPGHTPGHVIFYCEQEKIIFCGDVIFKGSIGRTDLPGGSYQTLINSIESQILSLPDETRLLTGHGPVTSIGEERLHNPFLT